MAYVVNTAVSIPITFYDSDGVGRSGLTVTSTARLAGTNTTVSASSVTDRGGGDYDSNITFPSVGTWRITSTATIDGETVPDITDVEVETAAQADPAAALSATSLTVSNPVISDGGPLKLYQGVDYATADGDSASWAITGAADLTAAQSVTLMIFTTAGTVLSKSGTVTDPGTTTQTITVEFTNAETTALDETLAHRYVLNAVLASGRKKRLTRGIVEVVPAEP